MTEAEKIYDLAIVGGGITGVGIAIEASKQGLNTILIEAGEAPASGTSDNTLRIIHGGFRYLQKMDFARTMKSIKAQTELLLTYPELIVAMRCLMPLNPAGLKSKYPARIGALLYGLLQKIQGSPLLVPQIASPSLASVLNPFLTNRFQHSALVWYDAQMLNPRELIVRELTGIEKNVHLLTSTRIEEIAREEDCFILTANDGSQIHAKRVVNAAALGGTGIKLTDMPVAQEKTYWGKAYNLVFKDSRILKSAFAVASPEGRQYFVVPRENNLIAVGTFTAKFAEDISQQVLRADIEKFNSVCPEFLLDHEKLVQVEHGILPAKHEFDNDADFLTNDIIRGSDGYLQVFTAKYTTYRIFGRKVIQTLLKQA